KLCKKLHSATQDELIYQYKVPFEIAETFATVSIMFLKFAQFFESEKILLPDVSLRDSLLLEMTQTFENKKFYQNLDTQIRVNALNVGRNLNFDESHAVNVTQLALSIYDQIPDIHSMGLRERSFLQAASLLHDIGKGISNRSHHKHSQYIIQAQDFFYFDENERNIIANIARYHRRSAPKNTHPDYAILNHEDKMIVMKLSAILRLADSLDNSHMQMVKEIKIEHTGNQLIFHVYILNNMFAEVYSFLGKKKLFEDFFGYEIKLQVRNYEPAK
ncbi:MAG: HD domain-containing protein, partial [Spirochaetes bacterium]|nr:HD domain-containing protein [Spirochaetota bacterium]